ncbi:hypothetical protein F4778DRAFT_753818 [Xylariomycetidae sp. FL2044]|nr:hypothetical protein F4778DRAFT_753818 [Xylariomycetidae sp. FL2044]
MKSTPNSPLLRLPLELLRMVIEELCETIYLMRGGQTLVIVGGLRRVDDPQELQWRQDIQQLSGLSQVNRYLYGLVAPILYHKFVYFRDFRLGKLALFLRTILASPQLANNVKTISLIARPSSLGKNGYAADHSQLVREICQGQGLRMRSVEYRDNDRICAVLFNLLLRSLPNIEQVSGITPNDSLTHHCLTHHSSSLEAKGLPKRDDDHFSSLKLLQIDSDDCDLPGLDDCEEIINASPNLERLRLTEIRKVPGPVPLSKLKHLRLSSVKLNRTDFANLLQSCRCLETCAIEVYSTESQALSAADIVRALRPSRDTLSRFELCICSYSIDTGRPMELKQERVFLATTAKGICAIELVFTSDAGNGASWLPLAPPDCILVDLLPISIEELIIRHEYPGLLIAALKKLASDSRDGVYPRLKKVSIEKVEEKVGDPGVIFVGDGWKDALRREFHEIGIMFCCSEGCFSIVDDWFGENLETRMLI